MSTYKQRSAKLLAAAEVIGNLYKNRPRRRGILWHIAVFLGRIVLGIKHRKEAE